MGIARTGLVIAASAATLGLGVLGVRAIRRRYAANAAELNETLPVHSKFWRDRAKGTGELLYVALGDSAAQGIGASAPDRGYVGLLTRTIARHTGRSVRTLNLSISGARIADAIEKQLPRLADLSPDVVTVAIGANDVTTFDASRFESGLATVFDALPPHAIVADLPCFYLPRNERRVADANAIVRRLASERGLSVAPLHAVTRGAGIRGVVTLFAKDLFHPNDRGYRLWTSAFVPAMSTRLATIR